MYSQRKEIPEKKDKNYMKNIKIICIVVLHLLAVHFGQVYAQKDDSCINVGIYVHGEENLNGAIEDFVCKELKSLANVVVTFSKLDCAIDIVVKKLNEGNSNAKGGYALSVTIVDRVDSFPITRAIEELDTIIPKINAQPAVIKQLEELSKELVGIAISTTKIKCYQNSFLYTGGVGQLRELCSKIVDDFNKEYLKDKKEAIRRKYY
ncbi:MAG: hypothetical protein GY777_19140 [Candidatus Brocadiaceae bacterium]|nr:hypothetical protein [Candidatus Brocadiaceae bacterium]